MYTLEQIKATLEDKGQPLSEALLQMQIYARVNSLPELDAWVTSELEGEFAAGPEEVKHRVAHVGRWFWDEMSVDSVEPRRVIRVSVPALEEQWSDGFHMRASEFEDAVVTYKVTPDTISEVLGAVRRKALVELSKMYKGTPPRKFYPLPDFAAKISDPKLAALLADRWNEANRSFQAEAYLSTIILLGSIIEGVLLDRFTVDAASGDSVVVAGTSAPAEGNGFKPVNKWKLIELIRVAIKVGWVEPPEQMFDALRDYRNLVHPNEHLQSRVKVDEELATMCWDVCNRAVRQLL